MPTKSEKAKKREKIMMGLIGVGVIVFLILDPYYFIWRDPPVPEETTTAPAVVQKIGDIKPKKVKKGVKSTDQISKGRLMIEREKIDLEGWRRDPFVQGRPDIEDEELITSMKLGIISVRGNDRMALINSQAVRPGDDVSGMKVDRIEANYVVLSSVHGREYILTWEK
ncbi:MAG: hypothetical protein HQ568_00250 [Calditrichaeota bacterium]|nr:hypothetical protein [Calditrichota bacterium]